MLEKAYKPYKRDVFKYCRTYMQSCHIKQEPSKKNYLYHFSMQKKFSYPTTGDKLYRWCAGDGISFARHIADQPIA
jgi:hypothetical protein